MNKPPILSSNLADKYFALQGVTQALIWFALILVIKYDTLLSPPIWDAAAGVFPAAIFLAENNFDVLKLIQLEDWWLGGPNVNAFISLTWLIALVLFVTKAPVVTYLVLHLLTFLLTGFMLASFIRCVDYYGVNRGLTFIAALLLLSTPLILVQAGFIYTDLPVMCFGVLAFEAWQKNREGLAVTLALAALSFKLTGAAIAVSIVLVLGFRFLIEPTIRRVWYVLLIAGSYLMFTSLYFWLGGVDRTQILNWGGGEEMLKGLEGRVWDTPEILILYCLAIIASLILLIFWKRVHLNIKEPSAADKQPSAQFREQPAGVKELFSEMTESPKKYQPLSGALMLLASFLIVYSGSIIFAASQGYLFLPRYFIPIIPLAMIAVVLFAKLLKLEPLFRILFLLFCYLNIVNHNGALYNPSLSFAITERSHAYKDYSKGHSFLIDEIVKLPDDVPIYVSREIGYLVSHPMLGRVNRAKPNIVRLYRPEYIQREASEFPANFYFVVSTRSRIHGGGRMRELLPEMRTSADWEVDELQNKVFSGIDMGIYKVSRNLSE